MAVRESTELPVQPGTHRRISRVLLPDGIYPAGLAQARLNAQCIRLLCNCEPQRIHAATLDVIEELSGIIHSCAKSCIVIYGSNRTYFAARLLLSGRLAHDTRLVLSEGEPDRDALAMPRTSRYEVDTDRYPFTDDLLR